MQIQCDMSIRCSVIDLTALANVSKETYIYERRMTKETYIYGRRGNMQMQRNMSMHC